MNVVTDESEQEFGGVMLELDLLEDSGQLMGTLGYNVDLFKESTVIRIAQQFQVHRFKLPYEISLEHDNAHLLMGALDQMK